jgi:hypothetical protein
MKTAELEGKILDYYVALAVGHTWRCKWMLEEKGYNAWQSYEEGWGNPTPPYSSDWAAGGPIIERANIGINLYDRGKCWGAWFGGSCYESCDPDAEGPTPLIAAMRAYVALHFGPDVPDVEL